MTARSSPHALFPLFWPTGPFRLNLPFLFHVVSAKTCSWSCSVSVCRRLWVPLCIFFLPSIPVSLPFLCFFPLWFPPDLWSALCFLLCLFCFLVVLPCFFFAFLAPPPPSSLSLFLSKLSSDWGTVLYAGWLLPSLSPHHDGGLLQQTTQHVSCWAWEARAFPLYNNVRLLLQCLHHGESEALLPARSEQTGPSTLKRGCATGFQLVHPMHSKVDGTTKSCLCFKTLTEKRKAILRHRPEALVVPRGAFQHLYTSALSTGSKPAQRLTKRTICACTPWGAVGVEQRALPPRDAFAKSLFYCLGSWLYKCTTGYLWITQRFMWIQTHRLLHHRGRLSRPNTENTHWVDYCSSFVSSFDACWLDHVHVQHRHGVRSQKGHL